MTVTLALIEQVTNAMYAGIKAGYDKSSNETDTVTVISVPMWKLFCAENLTTEHKPMPQGYTMPKIYGSNTAIVDSPLFFSFSIHAGVLASMIH
jgi:hypothetical protein